MLFYVLVDGGWSDYGPWSECSQTERCGNGTMERYRTCNNPASDHGGAECVGENVETENCDIKPPSGKLLICEIS